MSNPTTVTAVTRRKRKSSDGDGGNPTAGMKPAVSVSEEATDSKAHAPPGYIPKKWHVRSCICGSKKCRKIVLRYAQMRKAEMTKYIIIPNHPQQVNTELRRYKKLFFKHIAHYFPHWAKKVEKLTKEKKKKKKACPVNYLSITHFPLSHRDYLWRQENETTQRWRIPFKVGTMSGLKEQQLQSFGKGGKFYFASPMLSQYAVERELGDLIRPGAARKGRAVLNEKQSEWLSNFQEKKGYLPITANEFGISPMNVFVPEPLKTRSSKRLKGKQIICQCKKSQYPSCVNAACSNNNNKYYPRECDQSNCSFGEEDCGNRFTTSKQVQEQSRARFVKKKFKSPKYEKPQVGYGLMAITGFTQNDIIGEYVGEVKQRKKGDSCSQYCVEIAEDIVIDAEKRGNFTRFIQHSCEPNCDLIVRCDKDMRNRAWIRANKDIQNEEWITFNYSDSDPPDPDMLQEFFFNNKGCVCSSEHCVTPRK